MSVNAAAELAEKNAFKKIRKLLGNPGVFAEPAGSEAGFPDFGFSVMINKRRIDLFFEYKADHKAQMGSMRNWIFSSGKFTVPDADDENKKLLLEIMNGTPSAIREAKRLLKDFKTYFDKGVTEISSGMLSIISDKKMRKKKAALFASNTDNYQIANIEDARLGKKIMDHYYKKFHKNQQAGSDGSILYMMMGDAIWHMESNGVTNAEEKFIAKLLGAGDIPALPDLVAKLECRIQPRHTELNKPAAARIDVLAVFRLARRPSGGHTV